MASASPATNPHPEISHPETARDTAHRAVRINAELAAEYPDARCELDFRTPLELLVATVLSAQCTDARVNQVTPRLFARYPEAVDYAAADRAELEEILRPLGFQRAKAGHLIGIGEGLVAEHEGRVPDDVDKLVALPGVGRKTALVVLGNAFGVPGLTVDTHLGRLAQRMGLSAARTPLAIERDLARLLPREEWTAFSHRVIIHGRRVCHSRTPECGRCCVARLCPAVGVGRTR